MSLPTNERLHQLLRLLADDLRLEHVEQLFRQAGEQLTEQEVRDLRHSIRRALLEYIERRA